MTTDPIADLLTRIRNGSHGRKEWVEAPWSRLKEQVARVIQDEGFLKDVTVREASGRKLLRVFLKYDAHRRPIITGIRRVSRPSLRVYVKSQQIPVIRRGLGVTVLSTPKGVIVDRAARKEKVGGELLCSVW